MSQKKSKKSSTNNNVAPEEVTEKLSKVVLGQDSISNV
jgi:hypothetical protein